MGDAQRGCQILTKDLQIDLGVAVVGNALIFNEVTRESGAGNDVLRAFMHRQIGNVCRACQHQSPPVFIAETRGVFLDQKQVQPVALFGRLAHQILVTTGKGVGIHHNAANALARLPLTRQLGRIALQAARAVFHQHHDARYPGDGIKTTLAEQRFILDFGIDK
ncbi:hypothetical protein D3C80_1412650 [compost metagenome]